MSLAGMETLTGLRALTYKPGMKPWHRVQAATTALAQALPNLQHLTSLQLEDDVACDAVLLSIGSCTRLEQLTVRGACCSAEGLQQLPTSLTQLLLCWGKGQPGCVVTISPSTTPRLCQLAALHHMHISGEGVQSFDTAVLDGLTSLASMALSLQRFTASPGQHRFQALAAQKLPCLSQVTLTCEDMGVWLAQEAAALTAAAQSSLTALHLQGEVHWHSLGCSKCLAHVSCLTDIHNLTWFARQNVRQAFNQPTDRMMAPPGSNCTHMIVDSKRRAQSQGVDKGEQV
jgi:hypothetical protein